VAPARRCGGPRRPFAARNRRGVRMSPMEPHLFRAIGHVDEIEHAHVVPAGPQLRDEEAAEVARPTGDERVRHG
jgi:hypothetical protein